MTKNKKRKVILIDDDAEYRLTLREALEDAGYVVDEASLAKEAIEKTGIKKHGFDVALVDVRLHSDDDPHDHSGLKLLRDLPNDLPTIILTAHEDARVVRAAYRPAPGQSNPQDYMFKGDGIEAVLLCVANVISHSSTISKPWYKEPAFIYLAIFTILIFAGGGFYIEHVSNGGQILEIVLVGMAVDIFAGIALKFLNIGQ